MIQNRYKFDYITLHQYGDMYKLTYHKTPVRVSGNETYVPQSGKKNVEKLDNSYSRTKSTIKELALCNSWDYFVTLTLDQTKYDRYDLAVYRKNLSQFIRNYNRLHDCAIRYLLIPEQHKDGAWHMHGLVTGIPSHALDLNTNGYLDWADYSTRFGYCSFAPVKDKAKISNYITKYVSKDLAQRAKDLNAHLYYASKGLQRATLLHEGQLANAIDQIDQWDFDNEYVAVKWGSASAFDAFCLV